MSLTFSIKAPVPALTHNAAEEAKIHHMSFPPELIAKEKRRKTLIKWIAIAGFCAFVLFILAVVW